MKPENGSRFQLTHPSGERAHKEHLETKRRPSWEADWMKRCLVPMKVDGARK